MLRVGYIRRRPSSSSVGKPLTGTMTVLRSIEAAGGRTEYAKGDTIYIIRKIDGKPMIFTCNCNEVLNGQNLAQNIELMADDTVVVPSS